MKQKKLLIIVLSFVFSATYSQSYNEMYFAERTTTAGPDVESSKENIPVKKESFTDKLIRYKNEGFKVAVVLYSLPITTKLNNPNSTSTLSRNIMLKGNIPSMEKDFAPLIESFTAKMNEEFDTDIFEIVDIKKIPYKESKFGKLDNWEATKYKMVITYYITPQYDYTISGAKLVQHDAKFTVDLSAPAFEYVNKKKGVKKEFIIRVGNLGFITAAKYTSKTKIDVETVEELHELVNPPIGADLVDKIQKMQDEKIVTYIKKCKK